LFLKETFIYTYKQTGKEAERSKHDDERKSTGTRWFSPNENKVGKGLCEL
jgi:hypothetical protein